MEHNLYEAILMRRSRYDITGKINLTEQRLTEIIQYAVKHTPSPFNMQSQRAVILLGQNHKKLWDITLETLRKIIPADKFAPTEERIKSFAAGYGSILYYTDAPTVAAMQAKFPDYAENFTIWAQQCMGMLQYVVWTELAAEGIGASLQHYNPLIDAQLQKEFNIPPAWQLAAQMPFGIAPGEPEPKDFLPIEERVKIFR